MTLMAFIVYDVDLKVKILGYSCEEHIIKIPCSI